MNDAMIEIWQANPAGRYAHPEDTREELPLTRASTASAACVTDDEGRFEFVTVKPGPVPGPDGQAQAPHIEVSVFARGLLKRLVTRIYFPDEAEANEADPVLCSVADPEASGRPGGRRGGRRATVRHHLQGDGETPSLPFERAVRAACRVRCGDRRRRLAPGDAATSRPRWRARRPSRAVPTRPRGHRGCDARSLRPEIAAAGRAAANPARRSSALDGAVEEPRATSPGRHQPGRDGHGGGAGRKRALAADRRRAGGRRRRPARGLADEHRATPMAGRTLLQQALPTTFGLKAAGWLVAVDEARERLAAVPLAVELGGAAGTLASLGDEGLGVLARLGRGARPRRAGAALAHARGCGCAELGCGAGARGRARSRRSRST